MWREGRVGPGCESASSSMVPEPILAPLIKGRRPMNVYHYPSLGSIRYKKLEKVTDVRYGPPLLPISALVHGSITPRVCGFVVFRLSVTKAREVHNFLV